MAFGSMKCNAICLFGGLDSGSILSVMQYHVIRYCPIHRWYRSSPTLIALPPSLRITVTLCYRYDTELIKVSNQRSHQLNPGELISFAITLHEDEPNTTFISRGKPNQKNEPHKDKKSTKQERRKKGRKEGNRTNTATAAAKDLQPAAKTRSLRTAT